MLRTADALISSGPTLLSLTLTRWQRDDDAMVALLARMAASAENERPGAWAVYAFVGPNGRRHPRLRPLFRELGFPELP